jgi:hypothetical protein
MSGGDLPDTRTGDGLLVRRSRPCSAPPKDRETARA